MKKIISLVLAFLLVFAAVPVFASDTLASPYYIHIRLMAHNFDIDTQTGEASVLADMMIKSGSYCTVAAEVQKKVNGDWDPVVTYRATGGTSATISEDFYLDRGYIYKCIFTFTVYDEYDFIIEQKIFSSQEIDYT